MEQLEKISTLAYKKCPSCQQTLALDKFFRNKARRDGHTVYCKVCHQERVTAYCHTPQGKACTREKNALSRGRNPDYLRLWEYRHRGYWADWRKNHPNYEGEWRKNHPDWARQRYHGIQGEASCHSPIDDFYPAYRMIKALQEAETVEIRV